MTRAHRSLYTGRSLADFAPLAIAIVLAATGCNDGNRTAEQPGPSLCSVLGVSPSAQPAPVPDDLTQRQLPAWYDDAKLGIMIHWGPFAVPGWAERTLLIGETSRRFAISITIDST